MPASDHDHMLLAVAAADRVRGSTAPNPWVGCVIVAADGARFSGATQPPPGKHAEVVALDAAGGAARGSTAYVTLEPCSHHGRTGPCTDALIAAGVKRVVIGTLDPDEKVNGRGVAALRSAGIEVSVGTAEDLVLDQLGPYLYHRTTGRPFVTLKLAASIDGRTAAPDGSSRWITGEAARTDVHRMRARCDAILVGAGTVRTDDPALDVRHVEGANPRRFVLGSVPPDARVRPCTELFGPLPEVLDRLGADGVIDLLVEGGARVAHDLHSAGLVDRYVVYLAPMLFAGDDAHPMFVGSGASNISQVWRGRLVEVTTLGDDIRVTLEPGGSGGAR